MKKEKTNANGSANGMIRLEAGRVLNAVSALQAISNRFNEKVPFIDSYAVSRLAMRLNNNSDVQATEKQRRELIIKFGEKDEATGNVRITPLSPRFKAYVDAYQPIADTMLDLPDIRRIHPKTMKYVLGVQPAETQALWPFLEECSEDLHELETEPEPQPPAPPQPPVPPQPKPTAKEM